MLFLSDIVFIFVVIAWLLVFAQLFFSGVEQPETVGILSDYSLVDFTRSLLDQQVRIRVRPWLSNILSSVSHLIMQCRNQ